MTLLHQVIGIEKGIFNLNRLEQFLLVKVHFQGIIERLLTGGTAGVFSEPGVKASHVEDVVAAE